MAEGHTLHRLARDLLAALGGRQVRTSSPQGRFVAGAQALDGRVLDRTEAHGKHLFLGFAGAPWLHVHLGLYGSFRTGSASAPGVRGALRLRLENDDAWADLRAPTVCELIDPSQKDAVHRRLGPDPLRRDADPDRAWARLHRSRTSVGALLMAQDVLAGVGNAYRAEVLFRNGIEPHRAGVAISRAEWDAVWADLRALMRAGVRADRIVTTRPGDRDRRSGPARREDAHYVYRRAGLPCRVCGTPVRSELMAGRTLYWCPVCQPG